MKELKSEPKKFFETILNSANYANQALNQSKENQGKQETTYTFDSDGIRKRNVNKTKNGYQTMDIESVEDLEAGRRTVQEVKKTEVVEEKKKEVVVEANKKGKNNKKQNKNVKNSVIPKEGPKSVEEALKMLGMTNKKEKKKQKKQKKEEEQKRIGMIMTMNGLE